MCIAPAQIKYWFTKITLIHTDDRNAVCNTQQLKWRILIKMKKNIRKITELTHTFEHVVYSFIYKHRVFLLLIAALDDCKKKMCSKL